MPSMQTSLRRSFSANATHHPCALFTELAFVSHFCSQDLKAIADDVTSRLLEAIRLVRQGRKEKDQLKPKQQLFDSESDSSAHRLIGFYRNKHISRKFSRYTACASVCMEWGFGGLH